MSEYIDRDYVLKCMEDSYKSAGISAEAKAKMTRWLNKAPAADVRPVVLCRDCKWTELDGMDDPAIYCKKWDRWEMPLDGFCWLGKKREES